LANYVSELSSGVVAVVDDDEGVRRALQRVLETAGFTAETFDSAESMLAADAASRALCLVLDIHLPGMSGVALARHLVSTGINLPVIFITARDSADPRWREVGAADFLVKPFRAEALVAAVDRALAK
jgi:FixJ family two-component response regulator